MENIPLIISNNDISKNQYVKTTEAITVMIIHYFSDENCWLIDWGVSFLQSFGNYKAIILNYSFMNIELIQAARTIMIRITNYDVVMVCVLCLEAHPL